MASFAHQLISYTGTDITFATPDVFPSTNTTPTSDRAFLWVKNNSAGTRDVSIEVPGTTFGQANANIVVNLAAGEQRFFGPINTGLADPAVGGFFNWTHVSGATVVAAVVALPTPPPDLP